MEYKSNIINLLEKLDDEKYLKYIYILIKTFLEV